MNIAGSATGARPVALEVAVTSPTGAKIARDGGADRVELCTALELGGLTPSLASIEGALEIGGVGVHVLVRPRPGDFVYDADEVRTIFRDIVHAVRAGAGGIVVGALTQIGTLDLRFLAASVAAARSVRPEAEVTLHRAIDQMPRPSEHVGRLARIGITRVLTSGGGATALEAVSEVARTVTAAGPVQVMAGGGVSPASVAALVGAGVAAVHLSAKRSVAPQVPSRVAVGIAGEDTRWVTDRGVVTATRAALDAAVLARSQPDPLTPDP